MRSLARAGLGLVALLAAASILSHLYFTARADADRHRLEAALLQPEIGPDALREDLSFLRHLLEAVHPAAFPSQPLGDYAPALDAVDAAIDGPLDRLAFYRRLAPAVNLLNDEHTMVFPPDGDRRRLDGPTARVFPLDVVLIGGRLFVAGNRSTVAAIRPGDEVLSVGDYSAADLVATLSQYYSGTGTDQKQFYAVRDIRAALPLAIGVVEPYRVTIRHGATQGGEQHVLEGAVPGAPEAVFAYDVVAPGTMLLRWRAFEDDEGRFDAFLEELFGVARDEQVGALVIDLRQNQGGATACGDAVLRYLAAAAFTQIRRVEVTISADARRAFLGYVPAALRWLPVRYLHPWLRPLWSSDIGDTAAMAPDPVEPFADRLRFGGAVFLLTGPGTMSSASLFAATLQALGLAVVVGEATGGHATMYGNVIDARLPNSGLKVWMPTSVVEGLATGPVMPDHPVSQSAADLARSRDTVLDYAIDLAAGRPGWRAAIARPSEARAAL